MSLADAHRRAPLGPTLALTVTLALACFAIALALVMLLSTPTQLPAFHAEENQHAESALYGIAFAVILPVALITVPRLADEIAAGPNGIALSLLSASLMATLAMSIIVARVLPGSGGVVKELVVVGVWSAGTIGVLARARRTRPWALW